MGEETIQEYCRLKEEMKALKKEKAELKRKIRELEEQAVEEAWRREYEHRDDWRKPVEMGQL